MMPFKDLYQTHLSDAVISLESTTSVILALFTMTTHRDVECLITWWIGIPERLVVYAEEVSNINPCHRTMNPTL